MEYRLIWPRHRCSSSPRPATRTFSTPPSFDQGPLPWLESPPFAHTASDHLDLFSLFVCSWMPPRRRLDQHVEIPLPSLDSRRAIAKYYLSKLSLVDTDDYFSTFPALFGLTSPPQQPALPAFADRVAMMCDGCSSAVIEDVCREAGMAALRRDLREGVVKWSDIADSSPTARVPKPRV